MSTIRRLLALGIALVACGGTLPATSPKAKPAAGSKPRSTVDPALLIEAIRAKDTEKVLLLVRKGADINVADSGGWTPLMVALRYGENAQALEIIRKGARVDVSNKDGWTPLMLALRNKKPEAARILVERGAPLDRQNQDGWTALMIALRNAEATSARLLVDRGADIQLISETGRNAFWIALENQQLDLAQLLLERGARIDLVDADGWTPLMTALNRGHTRLAAQLLEKASNLQACNKDGWTPLMFALRKEQVDLARSMVERGARLDVVNRDGWTPLAFAVRYAPGKLARFLVEQGASVKVRNKGGWSPLMLSIRYGSPEESLFLIQHGSEIDTRDGDGASPILLAAASGDTRVIEALVDRKASVQEQDKKERGVLHYAAEQGKVLALERLLARGANLEASDKEALTPLLQAVRSGHPECVSFLLARGAKTQVLAKNENILHQAARSGNVAVLESVKNLPKGNQAGGTFTPLHCAGSPEAAAWLVAHGADLRATNSQGWTALHTAALDGREAVAGWLLDRGLDIDATARTDGREGISALYIAVVNKHAATAILLINRGAQLTTQVKGGSLAFFSAAEKGLKDVVDAFLAKGMNIHTRDEEGRGVIHYADGAAMLELLLSKGADLNAADKAGNKLIHYAAAGDRLELLQDLIRRGGDANEVTSSNETPLLHATSKRVAEFLLSKGARLMARSTLGMNALEKARFQAQPSELIAFLMAKEKELDAQITAKSETPFRLEKVADPNVKLVDSLKLNLAFDNYRGGLAMIADKNLAQGKGMGQSLLRSAANMGLPEACYRLAYNAGAWSRTTPLEQESRRLLRFAAEHGMAMAHYHLAMRLLTDSSDPPTFDPRNPVAPPNYAELYPEAWARLSLASAAGYSDAKKLLEMAAAGMVSDGMREAQKRLAQWNGTRIAFTCAWEGSKSARISIPRIQFFESPFGGANKVEKVSSVSFPKARTRCINWEMNLQVEDLDRPMKLALRAVYYDQGGKQRLNQETEITLDTGSRSGRAQYGGGFEEAGKWSTGSYTVDFYVGPLKVARCFFEVI